MLVISGIIVFAGIYTAFVINWGWKTGSIVMAAFIILVLLGSGLIFLI
jgi:hypothetical protein